MIVDLKREVWIDVARGIGIIAVVIGHSGRHLVHDLLFWFHMPLFFIISGYIDKGINSWLEFKPWIIKRTKQLLIPYISFVTLIAFWKSLIEFYKGNGLEWLSGNIINLILGGNYINDWFSIIWFITCLYATQIIFAIIQITIKTKYVKLLLIGICFIIAHVEANIVNYYNVYIPWNIDVALFSIAFYAFGYYLKPYIKCIFNSTLISGIIVISSVILFLLGATGMLEYQLDLKPLLYKNIFLDLFIPIILSLFVLITSRLISTTIFQKPVAYLGIQSLPIMYLHLAAVAFVDNFISINYFSYTIIGIVLPLTITWLLFNKFQITKYLFLGKDDKKNTFINNLKKVKY